MTYYCNMCEFTTGMRKHIRKHIKEKHNLPGGPVGRDETKMGIIQREPLSAHYHR